MCGLICKQHPFTIEKGFNAIDTGITIVNVDGALITYNAAKTRKPFTVVSTLFTIGDVITIPIWSDDRINLSGETICVFSMSPILPDSSIAIENNNIIKLDLSGFHYEES